MTALNDIVVIPDHRIAQGRPMESYRVCLFAADQSEPDQRIVAFPNDDAAIDHVGGLDHPYAMEVWQDQRLVARFPSRLPRFPLAGVD